MSWERTLSIFGGKKGKVIFIKICPLRKGRQQGGKKATQVGKRSAFFMLLRKKGGKRNLVSRANCWPEGASYALSGQKKKAISVWKAFPKKRR